MYRDECARCGRPQTVCYCEAITPVPTRTRVLLLQHPREHGNAINTARIAALALPNCELHVGVEFASEAAVNAALNDPERPAVILYPSAQARDLAADPPAQPVTLVVIDGTWHQARKLLRKNPHLLALPHYAFAPAAPSEYQIRREPKPEYVSTIEALACALPYLEGDHARFEALLAPFRRMVAMQVAFAARSTGGRKRERRRNSVSARARLPAELLSTSLLCVGGEANAWPYDRALRRPAHPHELVHWLGARLSDGARFEALACPRLPLAASPIVHARLDKAALLAASGIDATIRGFDAFTSPDDVLCVWGYYALELLVRERGTRFKRVLDIRKVAGDFLKQKPGSLEGFVQERGLTFESLGAGRGGERLGMLTAVTSWLIEQARAGSYERAS
jgi:DTW domain-containing protein